MPRRRVSRRTTYLRLCAARGVRIYGELIQAPALQCPYEPFITQAAAPDGRVQLVLCSAQFLSMADITQDCDLAPTYCPDGPRIGTNPAGDLVLCSVHGIVVGQGQLFLKQQVC